VVLPCSSSKIYIYISNPSVTNITQQFKWLKNLFLFQFECNHNKIESYNCCIYESEFVNYDMIQHLKDWYKLELPVLQSECGWMSLAWTSMERVWRWRFILLFIRLCSCPKNVFVTFFKTGSYNHIILNQARYRKKISKGGRHIFWNNGRGRAIEYWYRHSYGELFHCFFSLELKPALLLSLKRHSGCVGK
jgi:hypothetical protein